MLHLEYEIYLFSFEALKHISASLCQGSNATVPNRKPPPRFLPHPYVSDGNDFSPFSTRALSVDFGKNLDTRSWRWRSLWISQWCTHVVGIRMYVHLPLLLIHTYIHRYFTTHVQYERTDPKRLLYLRTYL